MYQQINMYQPVFRRQRKIFSAATLLQIIAVSSVILSGFYLHAKWTLSSMDGTLASLSEQHTQIESRLNALESTNTASAPHGDIVQLRQSISERQSLLDNFNQLTVRNNHGFSNFFDILARNTTSGLWLTGIKLLENGETELRGATLNPQLVPRYLQDMPAEPRFIALHQGSVHLARHEPEKADIEFVLSSNTEEQVRR